MKIIFLIATLLSSQHSDDLKGQSYLQSKDFAAPSFTLNAFNNLHKQWKLNSPPDSKTALQIFESRYGMHQANYPNDDLPMGLKLAPFPLTLGTVKGIALDCLICHGGILNGKSYPGLGNNSLDLQTFFEDMNKADGNKKPLAFRFGNSRGTNEAGAVSVFLLGFRNPDLSLKTSWVNLGLDDQLHEDPPAWWLLKKKKSMYATGGADARSVRSLMQFMMSPIHGPDHFNINEKKFANLQAYMLSIQPPVYPFPIDYSLAKAGKTLFENNCSKCHGTYGDKPNYPNKIIPLKVIGTDTNRFFGITKEFGRFYNSSWFSKEVEGWFSDDYKARETNGYQAPPLDGVWATAPYLHNGSVPSIYSLLNSKTRPKVFTRDFENKYSNYNQKELGWNYQFKNNNEHLDKIEAPEQRKWYDTSTPGRLNIGHTFGDDLTEQERSQVIEYLKTL
ncbi:MAG: hypothetical protein EBT92_01245 [Planctomycetes bacterium]|nr:hypothetical protein [Planctomycetota bacterium]